MRRFLKSVYFLVAVGLGAVAVAAVIGVAVWANSAISRPGPLVAEHVVVIPQGASLKAIAGQLEDEGVIKDRRLFRVYARYKKVNRGLRAGEYAFPAGVSIADAMEILAEGKAVLRFVTIPEGLTSYEITGLIHAAEGLTGEIEIPAEGSLLPETYTFSLDEDRGALVARMRDSMRRTLAELWEKRAENLPVKTPEEAIILASIVEKETGVPEERPRVAAVFVNRLRRGMMLQTDPTIIYALSKGKGKLDRELRFKDLEIKNPYNTYRNVGLPPGPICNPGRAALEAVLNPIDSKELYFVADGSGGHAFAKTLVEHNRNVEAWRKFKRDQRRKSQ